MPIAFAGEDDTICTGEVLLIGNNPSPEFESEWMVVPPTAANIFPISDSSALANIVFTGVTYTFVYRVYDDSTGCESFDTVLITSIEEPVISAGLDQVYCDADTAVLNGSNNAGTGIWSTISTAMISDSSLAAPVVSNLQGGMSYDFIWTV